ncbi:hypothetical protein ABZT02_45220, partial [Streptomyces sp. NPDC005402]|uniref:hypothetical protein n=1 Tax=Streptomyces sp. NPDC005402 TaxID=3155338 RepID=UPI0033A99BDB
STPSPTTSPRSEPPARKQSRTNPQDFWRSTLAFALGPAGDIVSGNWLYAFSLNLRVGSASVSVPKSALSDVANWKDQVLEAAAKQMALEGAGREEGRRCYASTLKTVWQVLNEARYVPAGLEEFAIKLEALLAA